MSRKRKGKKMCFSLLQMRDVMNRQELSSPNVLRIIKFHIRTSGRREKESSIFAWKTFFFGAGNSLKDRREEENSMQFVANQIHIEAVSWKHTLCVMFRISFQMKANRIRSQVWKGCKMCQIVCFMSTLTKKRRWKIRFHQKWNVFNPFPIESRH